jgi:DNA-binding HxlR family transcriptional regulator
MGVTDMYVSGFLHRKLLVPASETECAVETTVAVVGGKWKPILLFHLLSGAKRYSQLQKLVPQASDRMLTRTLRELEEDKLIDRCVFAEVPARVEYSLTRDGESLIPVLNAMSDWGSRRSKAVVKPSRLK